MSAATDPRLIVIGENIHCTRVFLRKGKRIVSDDGVDAIAYQTVEGEDRRLPIPDQIKATKDFDEGRVKHVHVALQTATGEIGDAPDEGLRYLHELVRHQEQAGADFLDLNVDEISPKLDVQTAAMDWLVRTIQDMTALPISVDSSSVEVIQTGLEAHDPSRARPMLNSASLERLDALDLAKAHNARVVVTAAGEKGMPDGCDQRVENASRMVEAASAKGFALDDLFIDPLVFPVSVDTRFGHHCLDAIRDLRARFGPEIHITGGISNVSFGIPSRRLLNEIFLLLAMEAGADSGILDPVVSPRATLSSIDRAATPYKMAEDVLLDRDEHCMKYIKAWRKGGLALSPS